jgi:hypothetical protein
MGIRMGMTTHPAAHGRLNLFQRLVRQWDAIHPYNAAQAIRIQGKADVPAIRTAWHDALGSLGLGRAHVERDRFYFEHLNGQLPRDVVRHVTDQTLEAFLSRELNRRFDEHDVCPFRPFVLDDDGGQSLHRRRLSPLVADGVSIRGLLRQWFLCHRDPDRARREPLQLAREGYWSLFGPHAGRWTLGDGVLNGLRWTSRFRRVRRMNRKDAEAMSQAVTIRRVEDGLIDCLRDVTRAAGVTLHDLILAAAAEACDKHLPLHSHGVRHDLAMGAIVDLRPQAKVDLSNTFGMFLGFTTTLCRTDDLYDWPRLLRAVATQNAQHKRAGHSQASVLRMAAGLVAGRVLPAERMVDFYRKRVPWPAAHRT